MRNAIKTKQLNPASNKNKREQGAALVTVMIMMLLVLVVAGAILLVTALSNSSTVDAVAEKQAFEAAQAGMQQALNVLRGNVDDDKISFKKAATLATSNKSGDWVTEPRLSNWLDYSYPAAKPDRVPLTTPYNLYSGLAYSVTIVAPDANPLVSPTPNPTWIDGPVVKPASGVKPGKPAWHPWNCGHCSWDYTHCSLYNPPNSGTLRSDGNGCRHKHCIPPSGFGAAADGYQRLVVRVVGYGPRGARKQLELLVKRVIFDYQPESLLYLQGSPAGGDTTVTITGTPRVKFEATDEDMTVIGVTSDADLASVQPVIAIKDNVLVKAKGDEYEVFPLDDRPKFLASADAARALMKDLEADAQVRGRWFTSYPIDAGTQRDPEFTFVSGNTQLNGNGAGLLVVSGNLTLNGNYKFEGVILILGGGTLNVTSGGKGRIEGNIVIAKYGATGDFQGSVVNLSGGELEVKSNAENAENALKTVNLRVLAVREN